MSATVREPKAETAQGDAALAAPALLPILWADPRNMAEHLALWSLERFGPRAETAVEELRRSNPGADRDELERLVVERQATVATAEGAFVGGPFIFLIPVAFCAALLAQAQMVYELAAVAGENPADEARAADLLVVVGAHPSAGEATAALERVARDPRHRPGKRLPRWDTVRRMAYLLGLLGGDDRSRVRAAAGWAGIGVLFLVGLVLPLVWVPYMAYSMRRSTLRVADRALGYYSGERGAARHVQTLRLGGVTAFARTVLLVVLPVAAAFVALLTDFSFGGGRWVRAGIVLVVVSALATLAWLGLRRWRHRRARRRAGSEAVSA